MKKTSKYISVYKLFKYQHVVSDAIPKSFD